MRQNQNKRWLPSLPAKPGIWVWICSEQHIKSPHHGHLVSYFVANGKKSPTPLATTDIFGKTFQRKTACISLLVIVNLKVLDSVTAHTELCNIKYLMLVVKNDFSFTHTAKQMAMLRITISLHVESVAAIRSTHDMMCFLYFQSHRILLLYWS